VTTPGGVHSPAIEVIGPEPADVPVGSSFAVRVKFTCPEGCDLSAAPIAVVGPGGPTTKVICEGASKATDSGPSDNVATGDVRSIRLDAPPIVGEHVWRFSVPANELAGFPHASCAQSVKIRARPHDTSLAVWAIPSPVVTGQGFAVKAGAKSTAGCDLSGRRIEVLDEGGTVLTSGSLGDTPWPGTAALYWTELQVPAPHTPGMFSWLVRFDPAGLALPHEGAASHFSIAIVDPPEHRLTVKVFERDTAAPIADAHIRLGAYRGLTDPSGTAEIMLPKGAYDLNVWRAGYEAPTSAVTIAADATVEVEVTAMPEDNPDAAWQM
jgi:hypothetical protein